MNWKKFAAALSFAAILPTTAFAHGELWYDVTSHLPQFKKIVIYPIKGLAKNPKFIKPMITSTSVLFAS